MKPSEIISNRRVDNYLEQDKKLLTMIIKYNIKKENLL